MIDTILFDWDGTLIDTAGPAYEATRKVLQEVGITIDAETYARVFSPNWYRMYEALGLPKERWQQADDLWETHYPRATAPLLPGVRETLEELVRRDFTLGIVTNGNRKRVLGEIDALGLAGIFRAVVCHEDVEHKKPHPEGLETALRLLEKRAESCCYVGDCPDDIEMGKRAGVVTVGITSAYPVSRLLPDSQPDYRFTSIRGLLKCSFSASSKSAAARRGSSEIPPLFTT